MEKIYVVKIEDVYGDMATYKAYTTREKAETEGAKATKKLDHIKEQYKDYKEDAKIFGGEIKNFIQWLLDTDTMIIEEIEIG